MFYQLVPISPFSAFNYSVNNINRSFVNAGIYHFRNSGNIRNTSITIDRPFYSTFAKWAAGVYVSSNISVAEITEDSVTAEYDVSSFQTDYWVGRAWQIFKGSSAEDRITSLITSFRYANLHYYRRPIINDTLNIYSNNKFYLFGAGISSRRYIVDKYVFKFGDTEDIPSGRAYGIILGYRELGNINDWYVGFRLAWGNYYNTGYFSTFMEYGTFTSKNRTDQGSFSMQVNYFTNLIEIGAWNFRVFVKPELTIGFNKLPQESISINDANGIRGFESDILSGKKRLLITFQTQSYAPWRFLGFRFGPYLIFNGAMLADENVGFSRSRFYTLFGLGLLIKNEYLVLNTFQLSLAYYPFIPGDGYNVLKINPLKTTDYILNDYDFSRPSMVVYQ